MDTLNSGLFIEDDELFSFAASGAKLLAVTGRAPGRALCASVRQDCALIRRCHDAVERRYGGMASPPPACEWLLDNWYMVRREYLVALSELRRAKRLRLCGDTPLIFELCSSLVQSGLGRITEERCSSFLDGFQSVTVLTRAELAAFPAALRAAILSELSHVCRSMQYAADTDEHARRFSALFSSLRLLSVLDMEKLVNAADVASAILAADPTGDYPRMDDGTKQEYLRRLSRLAAKQGLEEHTLAKRLIKKAKAEGRHVGFYLYPSSPASTGRAYIAANVLLTLFFTFFAAYSFSGAWAALLLLLPVSELVKSLIDYLLLHLIPPRFLPRMDMKDGVPEDGRSICVISTILGTCDPSRLEELRLACRSEGSNLSFGLLADLPAAKSATLDSDARLLREARSQVDALNRKYGGGFYLFTRDRVFNGEDYSGRERKRGAVTELAKLLCDEPSELRVFGNRDALHGMRYIITLDSDTRVYPGSVGELIGAALHPLCRPVIDERRKVVVSGHAILHPRMETDLVSANATDFSLIFAGSGGSDPYGGLCGELYMDAFENGGFAGKGLIDARALLDCVAPRIPEGRVLSHDALEGAYLHGGYLSDAAFSDAFPTRPLPFYKRQHRWIRGDWQNAPWIFRTELSELDRFRLFDSLRRSLIAPATFAAIVSGFFLPERGLAVAAWAALLALLSDLFISLAEGSMERREALHLRRHTRLLSGVGGAIVRTFVRLWLLPYEAWVCLSAIVTALWRMLISRKRLLQWQTAAQSELAGGDFASHIKAMWLPIVLGVLLMAFSPAIIGKASGFMWLLSPAAAAALALPAFKENPLSESDRDFLVSAAASNWRYLAEFSGREDNFLPPDNFQEQPPVGVAHRTSPTNIGLAMAASVAVADMGIIAPSESVAYVRRVVSTMEKLPRLMGHFFNWYDTQSLQPLKPAYISTVDSGNLYAGLLVSAAAMREYGEAELAGRIEALMAEMDFSPLYDERRGLFYICYDAANGRGAGGWYDLMASEARLTSYLAVAKGDVPKKHWRRLSRAQLQKDGYRGLASWTGTMFEYLMPELFLPVYRSSLLYESGRFCVYAQKKRAFAGKPWGISESAFYSLDAALSYRYKAHGCPALALKRGQEADMVISPYSSFLSLAIDPQGSVRNLRRLVSFGAVGRYGYIEAIDFTPGRCRSDGGEPVRCYMAHHVGMSIIAAANAVCSGSIRRRFMSCCAMRSHSLLLQEKLPLDPLVIRRDISEVPEKPWRDVGSRWLLRGGEEDRALRASVLSNGAYNIMLTNLGHSSATFGSVCVYHGSPDAPGVRLTLDGHPLMPCAEPVMWELAEESARIGSLVENISCSSSVCVAGGDCGELRSLELRAPSARSVSLALDFVPILAEYNDYVNHPAYWSLGFEAETSPGLLLLHRLPKGDRRGLWLCLRCSAPADIALSDSGASGCSAPPTVLARLDLALAADAAQTVRFALCVNPDRGEALDGAERILLSEGASPGNMVGAAATHLGMSPEEIGAAMELVLPLWANSLRDAAPRRELWQYAVSGDLPILCCDGRASESDKLLRRFCLLRSCGVNAELVFLSDEHGEYFQPMLQRLSQALSSVGLESLIGARGGVYLAPLSASGLVKSRAAVCSGEPPAPRAALPVFTLSAGRAVGYAPRHGWNGEAFEYYVNRSLPSRAWQHVLTNGNFGYLASDCGIGYLWLGNAREMRLTPPPDGVWAVHGAEQIFVELSGKRVSLFAANDGYACKVSYSPGLAVWEKEIGERLIRTTAFLPLGIDARVLLVEGAQGLRLRWALHPVLGADASSLRCRLEENAVVFENPESYFDGVKFYLSCTGRFEASVDYTPAAALLSCPCPDALVLVCGCCEKESIYELCKPSSARMLLDSVSARWRALTGRFSLRSSCAPLDRYISGWAVYQCVASRLEGRCSLYQSGGAIGFRDQLQDSVNLMLISPDYARHRILDCCRHQYVEGDVMHWWHQHPDGDRGVRTRCSDDLLWLCWALCEYVDATGDLALCSEETPYLTSPLLSPSEHDRYETPALSSASSSVISHAKAALERCISRGFGPHGLPLFGSGDWNDALDKVDGESVWLGWFFSHCADRLADLLERLGLPDAARCRAFAEKVGAAADECWGGEWYLRGYYADGEPLGGTERIDAICQSWAAMSRWSSLSRSEAALSAALYRLVDRGHGTVKLFSPPYSVSERSPGYITGYGRGWRENGGQYTHGAIWLAMAAFRRGRPNEGYEILRMLLPDGHDLTRYAAEPFVLAADVSAAPGHEGEAGWTWYTGSAGWYFRVVTQELLGLKLRGGKLYIEPNLPTALPAYSADWTDYSGRAHHIVCSPDGIRVDGEPYHGGGI